MLQSHSVDGLILDLHLITGNLDSVLPTLGPPYVLVNPSMARPYNSIKPDDPAAGRMAVEYLISRGHRRIGYVPSAAPNPHSSHTDRLLGYLHAMQAAGLLAAGVTHDPLEQLDHAGLCARIRDLVEVQRCTALVIYDGINAAKVLRGCYEMDLRVPKRVSLMACDDSPVLDQSVVPLSCFRFDRSEMGRMAFEMVLTRVRGAGQDLPTRILKGVVQERGSVQALA
jgi:LacI family transcriptional regulator